MAMVDGKKCPIIISVKILSNRGHGYLEKLLKTYA